MLSSGWSVYSTAFAGQTPCYTSPPTPLIPPAAASATQGSSISVINTKLFTLRFPLKTKKRGISKGAAAGIAIGCLIGALLALAIVFLFLRKRRNTLLARKGSHSPVDQTAPSAPMVPYEGDKRNSIFSQPHAPLGHISELPSPAPGQQPEMGFPPSQPLLPTTISTATAPLPPVPPAELLGDTYIHEHHPAHASGVISEGFPSPPLATATGEENPPGTPGAVVSPLSDSSETSPPVRVQPSWGNSI